MQKFPKICEGRAVFLPKRVGFLPTCQLQQSKLANVEASRRFRLEQGGFLVIIFALLAGRNNL
ncbi:hypothetical protein BDZ89DRAFT_1061024, partial [Hymenopellis radicata]